MRAFLTVLGIIAVAACGYWLVAWMQAACTLPAIVETKPLSCAEFWFNRYQTFLAAVIALGGAIATIAVVRYQTLSAERVARRTESEAESAVKELIQARTAIFAEVWRGIDWVFEPNLPEEVRRKRASVMWAVHWHSGEDRVEFGMMQNLVRMVAPPAQIRLARLFLRWDEMLSHLDTVPDEHSENPDFVGWLDLLRIKFSFIAIALERYDPLMADIFSGLRQPHVNPGDTAKRTAAVREAMKAHVSAND
ncbi:hypothetical protein [Bradyrhizobium zhanjiangense]|uniref:Uncharacterized protein n=1 Tax=Bradyrhizobium zhanjiangense TaxID=1325107 RepID=A0ABY0DA80_9BRAD|nr:hypothetical protein [Bradyrhizobium zhanjiangense]RXG87356.1 hypothetical protein EAS62_36055 [Bradyrhizobium zhanjiangense]